MLLCILKALIGWLILLAVSGAVGLFLRQALFGVNTIFCIIVSAVYLWAVAHFWNITLAITAFLMMLVVVEHYARVPRWLHSIANVILWGSLVLVWYALCKQT
jgi:hypothetical protein